LIRELEVFDRKSGLVTTQGRAAPPRVSCADMSADDPPLALVDTAVESGNSSDCWLVLQEGESENARRSDFERLYPTSDAER
jgi:hypothetical protein